MISNKITRLNGMVMRELYLEVPLDYSQTPQIALPIIPNTGVDGGGGGGGGGGFAESDSNNNSHQHPPTQFYRHSTIRSHSYHSEDQGFPPNQVITIFARVIEDAEHFDSDTHSDKMPYLLFLQGGPGFPSPR